MDQQLNGFMVKLKRIAPYLVAICVILGCTVSGCLLGVAGGRIWQFFIEDARELKEVSNRLGIDEDWNDLRDYVECDLLIVGTSRDEIEEQLLKVGSYQGTTIWDDRWYLQFDSYHVERYLPQYVLSFDEDDRLEDRYWSYFTDTVSIECP